MYVCVSSTQIIYIYIQRDVASFLTMPPNNMNPENLSTVSPIVEKKVVLQPASTRYMVRSMWVEGGVSWCLAGKSSIWFDDFPIQTSI